MGDQVIRTNHLTDNNWKIGNDFFFADNNCVDRISKNIYRYITRICNICKISRQKNNNKNNYMPLCEQPMLENVKKEGRE